MGLDMYLTGSIYLGGSYHNILPKRLKISVSKTFKGFKDKDEYEKVNIFPTDGLEYLEYQVGYWRKANQIHKWFVENVQNGEDDCKQYYVPEDKLKELKAICANLLKSKDKEEALKVLPPCDGFFFGSTNPEEDYFWDDYWEDLKMTVKGINKALKFIKEYNAEIRYQSSW